LKATIKAHCTRAKALYRLERDDACEATCHLVLRLAKYPNFEQYVDNQWRVLSLFSLLLYKEGRHCEAKELIAQIPLNLPVKSANLSVIEVAENSTSLGNLKIRQCLFELVSMAIESHPILLRQPAPEPEPNPVTGLVDALIEACPVLWLWQAAWR
jgi:hypothetical protein